MALIAVRTNYRELAVKVSDGSAYPSVTNLSSRQRSYFFQGPNVIRHANRHGRRNPQRLMDAAKLVVHEVQRHGVRMVLDLF